MNATVELRPATDADTPFLFALFRAIRSAWFDFQPGGHPQITNVVRLQFESREHALRGQYPHAEDYILLASGEPVGRILILRNGESIQVADLGLLPERHRQGLGRSVLAQLMEEAARTGLPARCLIALRDMPLFHFYRRMGFEPAGETAGHLKMEWQARLPDI